MGKVCFMKYFLITDYEIISFAKLVIYLRSIAYYFEFIVLDVSEVKYCPTDDFPLNYALIEDICYFFDTIPQTIEEAHLNCQHKNGKLWEAKTNERVLQIYKKAKQISPNNLWWVGMSDVDKEGTFKVAQ